MVVVLEVREADAPDRTPPTTMRCLELVGGVEAAGAVAVTAVAPLTVVMPWSMSGVALPE